MTEAAAVDEFKTIRGKVETPWKMLIYGVPGIGKSSIAAKAPGVFFLDLENGLNRIDVWRTPSRLTTSEELIKWLTWAVQNPEIKTIAIDTIDEVEKILSASVLKDFGAKALSDIPYGRGGDLLIAEWRKFLDIIDRVHANGKNTLFIGHEVVQKFENPSDANYDFFAVNLHKKAVPLVLAKLDAVLYAKYETFIKGALDEKGKEKPKGKAIGTGKRLLVTEQSASVMAKNRFGLPPQVPFDLPDEGKVFELIK